jgi:hypothetical protein
MNAPSRLPQFHIVGFTGHRQLAQTREIQGAVHTVLEALRQEGPGEWIALSSAAAGADMLFAQQALATGLTWHVVLPLPPAEFRKDFSFEEWKRVETLLPEAKHVRVISETGSRDDAYLDAGMEVVHECDVLLAVWDGQPPRGKGGTADVVAYARELNKPILIIDTVTGGLHREQFKAHALDDHDLDFFNRLPATPADAQVIANPFHAPGEIPQFQGKVDRAASRGAPQFRRLIAATVLLHVMATLAATAELAFGLPGAALPWVKLLCLLGALAVALTLRVQGTHHHWVRCRLAAEFCRSALATWGLPRAAPLFAELDLPGLRQLTRSLQVLHGRSMAAQSATMDEFKQLYLAHRIDDQHGYYGRRLAQALPLLRRLRAGFWVTTVLAIICTACYASAETWHFVEVPAATREWVFYFLPIALPVVAAAFLSLVSINDLHRRVARYREMQTTLEAARKQIAYSQTWGSLERIVQRTERALLQEVFEWHSITSFAESH